MPGKFYMIYAPKKINKIPEFYTIFTRKIFSPNFGGVSYSYGIDIDVVVLLSPKLCVKFEWSTVNGSRNKNGV